MKNYVWDTGALTLYFAAHANAKKIMDRITSNLDYGYIPRQVFMEFYYKTWQRFGEQAAKIRTVTLQNSQNEEIFIKASEIYDVGRLKVQFPKLSMVDAQVLTLGKRTNSVVLTTDEYLKVVSKHVLKFKY